MFLFIVGLITGVLLFINLIYIAFNLKHHPLTDDEKETVRKLIEQLDAEPNKNQRLINELFELLER